MPYAPHIDGYLNGPEFTAFIKQHCPDAPKYTIYQFRYTNAGETVRFMRKGHFIYVREDDMRELIKNKHFARHRTPLHIPGWLSRSEAQRIIAEDNPYAPKKFAVENLAQENGPRFVLRRKFGHRYLYNLADLKREMKRLPIYDGANKLTRRSMVPAPYHDLLPEDADRSVWMPVPQAAAALGLRSVRVHQIISHYRVKALAHKGRLYVNINEVREEACLRPDSFIRKHGLDPHQFKAVKFVNADYCGYTIRYCPELMHK